MCLTNLLYWKTLNLEHFKILTRFVENCIACFNPERKYSNRWTIAVDVGKQYLLSVFIYLGKSEEWLSDQNLSEYVVMRLMQPFLSRGINVTVNNFFTSLHLAKTLHKKRTSLVRIISRARKDSKINEKFTRYVIWNKNSKTWGNRYFSSSVPMHEKKKIFWALSDFLLILKKTKSRHLKQLGIRMKQNMVWTLLIRWPGSTLKAS